MRLRSLLLIRSLFIVLLLAIVGGQNSAFANGQSAPNEERDLARQKESERLQAIRRQQKERTAYAAFIHEFQRVIRFKNLGAKERVKSILLDSDVIIVVESEDSITVRPKSDVSSSHYQKFIEGLPKEEGVLSIEADSIMAPQAGYSDTPIIIRTLTQNCAIVRRHLRSVMPEPSDLITKVNAILDQTESEACELFPRCENGANPAWARLQLGADFADQVVADSLKSLEPEKREAAMARLGVLDTGFDIDLRDAIGAKSFAVERANLIVGDPGFDVGGHGTPVTSMAVGRGIGITEHAHMKVYRITEPNAGGTVATSQLKAAIRKACQENDIVNVSWGTLWDEVSKSATPEDWFAEAEANGCLVIKSAGNSGIRKNDREHYPIDAPILRVAALDKFSAEAKFTTDGLVAGPGAGVYAYLSQDHQGYSSATVENSCRVNGHTAGPINGTSFSAPAVQGVMGQVFTILNARGTLPKNKKFRIPLLKRIILASAHWNSVMGGNPGQINAVMAAMIAKGLSRRDIVRTESIRVSEESKIDTLIAQGKEAAKEICRTPRYSECESTKSCTQIKACVNDLRLRTMICPMDSSENNLLLSGLLRKIGEQELLIDLQNRLRLSNRKNESLFADIDALWSIATPSGKSNADKVNYQDLMGILRLAMDSGHSQFITEAKIRSLMGSDGFLSLYKIYAPLDDKINGTESVRRNFIEIFTQLSEAEQMNIINDIPFYKYSSYKDDEFAVLYHLHHNKEKLTPKVQEALIAKMQGLAESWFKNGKILVDSDHGIYYRWPVFEAFIKTLPNHQERLESILASAPNKDSDTFFILALKSNTLFSTEVRKNLATKVFLNHRALPYFNSHELYSSALDFYLTNVDPDSGGQGFLREFILANPGMPVPDLEFPNAESSFKVGKVWFFDDSEFWRSYFHGRIQAIQDYVRKENLLAHNRPDSIGIKHSFLNSIDLFFRKDKERFLEIIEENRDTFAFTANYVATHFANHGSIMERFEIGSKERIAIDESLRLIEPIFKVLDRLRDLDEAGKPLLHKISVALRPLALSVMQDPTKHEPSIRQEIRKLFDIDEICDQPGICANNVLPGKILDLRLPIADSNLKLEIPKPGKPVTVPESPIRLSPPDQSTRQNHL